MFWILQGVWYHHLFQCRRIKEPEQRVADEALDQIGEFVLWPFSPDVLGGYALLKKAAALDYPPAVYAVGVRLKHGDHVPRPPSWNGPAGNHFPQPERGQVLIDKAIQLGYEPSIKEEHFYWQQYRK